MIPSWLHHLLSGCGRYGLAASALILLACASGPPEASQARVYKWVDEDGVTHYVIRSEGVRNADPIPGPRERGAEVVPRERDEFGEEAGLTEEIELVLEPIEGPPALPPVAAEPPPEALLPAEPTVTPSETEAHEPLAPAAPGIEPRPSEAIEASETVEYRDVASPPPQHLLDEIAELEASIAADRELLKKLISQEGVQGSEGLSNDERIEEISKQLPARQSELAERRREAGL